MRLSLAIAVLLAALAPAQTPEPPELLRARAERERIRALVDTGTMARKALDDADAAVAQAQDLVVLQRTLYGELALEDLTEEQAREMVAAAERQHELQRRKYEDAKKLVEEGVLARTGLLAPLEELDRRRRTVDLAESRARLLRELVEMARAEQALEQSLEETPVEAPRIAERYDGDGVFLNSHLRSVVLAYERQFHKPMPVSARGATAVHRALGYDHRGRVDVGLNPDTEEGAWLRRTLEEMRVPYYAFRAYIPGKSTAPHIHIGPPSLRLRATD